MAIIQVPDSGEELAQSVVWFLIVDGREGRRTALEPAVVEVDELVVSLWRGGLVVVAVLQGVGADDEEAVRPDVVCGRGPEEVGGCYGERETDGSLLGEGYVEFLSEADPEDGLAETRRGEG